MKKKKEEQSEVETIGTQASICLFSHLKEIGVQGVSEGIALTIYLVTGTQEQKVSVLIPQEKAKEIAGKIFEVIGAMRERKEKATWGRIY